MSSARTHQNKEETMRLHLVKRAAAIATVFAAAIGTAWGQGAYPNRPINLVLPYSVGSSGDAAMRLLSERMSALLGQPIVIENQAGAAGLVGADKGRLAKPDGYTLVSMADSTLMYLPLLNKNANFDPLKDYEPITQVTDIGWVLVTHPSFPPKTVAEMVTYLKERPGKVDYASGGVASPQQIVMELFQKRTGVQLAHIPYKGSAPALTGVVGNQTPVMFSGIAVAIPFVNDNRLRALATGGRTRSPLMPNVPTMIEAGLDGFTFSSWISLMAPVGTPPDVVRSIHGAATKSLADRALVDRLRGIGMTVIANTPEEFRANLGNEFKRLSGLVADLGMKRE